MHDHEQAGRGRISSGAAALARRLRRGRWALALGALFVALGGVAYAATGSSSPFVGPHGFINTCVPASGGEVNVWKPGHRCSGGRVGLAFPAAGPTGASGASGAAGATGSTGATGATGPSNPDATTVDGISATKLLVRVPTPASGTTSQTLYNAGGLTILAECDSTGNASLVADGPASADAELTVSGYDSSGAAFGSQTASLGSSSAAALGPAGSGEASFAYAASAGAVVDGTVGYQKAPSFGTVAGCAFFGTVSSG